mgnify:CR=1 FL=1
MKRSTHAHSSKTISQNIYGNSDRSCLIKIGPRITQSSTNWRNGGFAATGAVGLGLTGPFDSSLCGEAKPRRSFWRQSHGKAEPFRTGCGEAAGIRGQETRHNVNKFVMSYGCNVDPVSCRST